MSEQEQERKIYEIASAVSQTHGFDLVEVKIGRHNKEVLIQVFADTIQGGIDLEQCAFLNRSIVEMIDKEGFLSEDGYSLEVSSPGLDRPLINYKDFLRNINNEISLWLKEKVENKKEYRGIIKQVTKGGIILSTTTKDQKEVSIPLKEVLKGLLVV